MTGNTPFSTIQQSSTAWMRSGGERKQKTPPFLAILGLCVLAASRMHAESTTHVGAGNYYGRLNQLLDRPGQKAPDDFQKTEDYWKRLGEWLNLDNRKERGEFRSQEIAPYTFIGPAMSQCLLREVDKEHLQKFFRDVNMSPGLAEEPNVLLPKLLSWCESHPNGLSVLARRLLREGDAGTRMLIAEAVAAEARHSTRTQAVNIDAARRATLALRIDVERGGCHFELQFFPSGTADSLRAVFVLISDPSSWSRWTLKAGISQSHWIPISSWTKELNFDAMTWLSSGRPGRCSPPSATQSWAATCHQVG